MTIKQFLNELGGVVAVANALKAPISTVSSWAQSNKVPPWRRRDLRRLAEKDGVGLPDFDGTKEAA